MSIINIFQDIFIFGKANVIGELRKLYRSKVLVALEKLSWENTEAFNNNKRRSTIFVDTLR